MQLALKGHVIEIDEADAPLVQQHNWQVRPIKNGGFQVYRTWQENKKRFIEFLHHRILPADPPLRVYFHDHNQLNVQRSNLYLASQAKSIVAAPKSIKWQNPFSPGRLSEMHWQEGKTLEEIAAAAAEIQGWKSPPSAGIVARWFDKAGIARRTLSTAMKRRARVDLMRGEGVYSKAAKEKSRRAAGQRTVLVNGRIIKQASRVGPHSKRTIKKIRATRLAQRPPDYWVTKPCGWCKKPITRPHWKMRKEVVFCDRTCSAHYYARDKHKTETRPCIICGTPITRRPCEFRREAACCSPHCIALYRARKRGPIKESTREKMRQAAQERAARIDRIEVTCALAECTQIVRVAVWEHKKTVHHFCCKAHKDEYHRRHMQAKAEEISAYLQLAKEEERAQRQEAGSDLLDVEQVAELLGITPSGVRTRIQRGKIVVAQHRPRILIDWKQFIVEG